MTAAGSSCVALNISSASHLPTMLVHFVAAQSDAVAGASSHSAAAVRRDSVRPFAHSETW